VKGTAGVLRGGVLASSAALAAGLLTGSSVVLGIGIALLICTPLLRVIAVAWELGKAREWAFVLFSIGVLSLLAASFALGWQR
jgi:uncharacterized membrane protein